MPAYPCQRVGSFFGVLNPVLVSPNLFACLTDGRQGGAVYVGDGGSFTASGVTDYSGSEAVRAPFPIKTPSFCTVRSLPASDVAPVAVPHKLRVNLCKLSNKIPFDAGFAERDTVRVRVRDVCPSLAEKKVAELSPQNNQPAETVLL